MKRIKLKEDAFPVNDPEAYKAYPHFRHLFNKYLVTKSQNVRCGKMHEIPKKFPVFVKPIVNLEGSNKDCYFVSNLDYFKTVSGGDNKASKMYLVNLQKLFSKDVIKAFKEYDKKSK